MAGSGSNFDMNKLMGLGSGLGGLFGGLFGGDPYKDAMNQYKKYANQASQYQNPFYNAGKGAIPDYQNYLNNMSNPSDFINQLMGGYSESPQAKYLQEQSMKAGQNAASASGLSGSTPMMQFLQQNSGDIASNDMNSWLQNVLGINQQYGQGLGNLLNMGQNSGNQLSNIFGNLGNEMAQGSYGSRQAKNQQMSDIFGGLGNLAMFAFL